MKERLYALGVDLVDTYGIIQPKQNTLAHTGMEYEWSSYYPSETAELIEATRAKAEVRDGLTRMIGAEIYYTREGYHMAQANDGYVNKKIMTPESKKKNIQIRDPERAPYFEEIFRHRVEGVLSDEEIVERINAMGYKSKDRNKWDKKRENIIGITKGTPMTVKYLQNVVQKPIYAGVKMHKWGDYKPIRQNYPGLISIDTFNKANRGKIFIKEDEETKELAFLYDHYPEKQVKKRAKYNPKYPYAKVIMCPTCNKFFKASATKNKAGNHIPAYHCDRGEKGKDKHYFRVPQKEFEDSVESFLDKLEFTPERKASFEFRLKQKFRERESEVLKDSSTVSHNIADLKTKKQTEVDAFVASANSPSIRTAIEERISELDEQISKAESERSKLDLKEKDIDLFLKWTNKIMEHPKEVLVGNDDLEAQTALWNLVFEELPTYEDIVNGTPKTASIFNVKRDLEAVESALVMVTLGFPNYAKVVI